jgi:hypothetical protein
MERSMPLFEKARLITSAIVAAALTAGSSWTLAAPPVQSRASIESPVVKINEHHKKGQHNNANRPANTPAPQQQRRRKDNNDALAVGVGIAAIIGAIALSQQSQAQPRDYGMRNDCRRLRWKCREGRGWACRKFDDMCR